MQKWIHWSVSLIIALSLAFVGGYLDIYTYIARGKVFANTQTGNLVLLGRYIVEGNTKKMIYYSLSILFFMLGIGLAKVVEHYYVNQRVFLWVHITIGIEILVLFLVMFIPKGHHNVLANILVSFVCAIQVQSFRKMEGRSYSTTMFTGNLKNAAERLSHFLLTKEGQALRDGIFYFFVILSFIFGAGVGTLLTKRFHEKAVGFASLLLVVIFFLLFYEQRGEAKQETPS